MFCFPDPTAGVRMMNVLSQSKPMTLIEWGMLFGLSLLWGGSFFFNGVAVKELPILTVVVGRVIGPGRSIQRHARLIFHGADRQCGAHMVDIARRRQVADDEILERGQIRRDAFQHEVDVAGEHGAFAHDAP